MGKLVTLTCYAYDCFTKLGAVSSNGDGRELPSDMIRENGN